MGFSPDSNPPGLKPRSKEALIRWPKGQRFHRSVAPRSFRLVVAEIAGKSVWLCWLIAYRLLLIASSAL
jgi:hypothetical protein